MTFGNKKSSEEGIPGKKGGYSITKVLFWAKNKQMVVKCEAMCYHGAKSKNCLLTVLSVFVWLLCTRDVRVQGNLLLTVNHTGVIKENSKENLNMQSKFVRFF